MPSTAPRRTSAMPSSTAASAPSGSCSQLQKAFENSANANALGLCRLRAIARDASALARASSSRPAVWRSFAQAEKYVERSYGSPRAR